MEALPNELLIKIFEYLSVQDLVNLSKVHQRYQDIITSNKKLKYYDIILDKKGKIESSKCRRIGQLTVKNFTPRIHQHVLVIFGSTITNITFFRSDCSFPKIAQVLKLCPNVKQIKFEQVSVWPEVIPKMPELNNLLVELIDSSTCVLDLFIKSKVIALRIVKSSEEYGTGIRGFLRTQPHIKSLYCRGPKCLDIFYAMGNSYNENYEELPFKLRILILRDVLWKPHYLDLFLPSKHHLKIIELIDITPTAFHATIEYLINKCSILEELTSQNMRFTNIHENKTITKMTLNGNSTCPWTFNLKALKTLRVSYQMSFHLNSFYDLSKAESIEELEIESSGLDVIPLNIPSVKRLKVVKLTSLASIGMDKFITSNNKIEELEIVSCGEHTKQILKEVALKMTHLRVLNVKGGFGNVELKNKIREMCIKLVKCSFNFDIE